MCFCLLRTCQQKWKSMARPQRTGPTSLSRVLCIVSGPNEPSEPSRTVFRWGGLLAHSAGRVSLLFFVQGLRALPNVSSFPALFPMHILAPFSADKACGVCTASYNPRLARCHKLGRGVGYMATKNRSKISWTETGVWAG